MNCIVTAGPTYEELDKVRRLTNFSTGRLGTELANFLTGRRHDVRLLVGEQATWGGERKAKQVEKFTTTADLTEKLAALAGEPMEAVFHAAAVSDFMFGKIWCRSGTGELTELKAGKISTREGTLLAELKPTAKIISELRHWFPKARIVGWKFEVDGDRRSVIRSAEKQMADCLTDACVANGPAYGEGFALVQRDGEGGHLADATALYEALEAFATGRS